MELARGGVEVKPRKRVMNLAWPAILEMFMSTLVQFVDTAMVGQLGAVAISAVSLNTSPMWFITGIFTGVSVGATALVARYIGANKLGEANNAAKQSLILGTIMGAIITILTLTLGQYLPKFMGAEPEVLPYATMYLKILGTTFILHFISFIASGILRGAGDTKTPMRINVLANIVNIIGNFFLIFPTRELIIGNTVITIWGADLGVIGAAISTAFSRGLAGIIVLYILFSGKLNIKLKKEKIFFDVDMLFKILKIGAPAAMERVVMSSGQILFTRVVATLGTTVLAAHHLAIVAESISYMPGFGFSMAATTLVGQGLGENKPDDAYKYGMETLKIAAIVMTFMGVVFFFFPHYLLRIFSNDHEVIAYGSLALKIVAFSQPFFASAMVLSGALRGAGDTVWPLLFAVIGMWVIRLSLAYILVFGFNLALMGAWIAMAVDLGVRGTMMYIRFKNGKWKNISIN
ncbi:putative efflux protein, MATE family [Anaerobranca californiensis DSM 14826]|uniref:Probable multidrug resistance protein NorM n=1 Tax=Anaerobranca californiensis DSM 14826 TaxID=1120989 RepID=A0A1M6P6W2_9FIRM|nr:MATE family efflux transporter [Anaerobranca californiensis]SHK03684.1 putative efflux protein, MATE family [Anaerobranca californiensis DSM 14826]